MEGDGVGVKCLMIFKFGGMLIDGIDDISVEKMMICWWLLKEDINVFLVSFYINSIIVIFEGDGVSVMW